MRYGGRNNGMYRGVQVGKRDTAATQLRNGKEVYRQLDNNDEILVNWNEDHYEVEYIGIQANYTQSFEKVKDIETKYNISL